MCCVFLEDAFVRLSTPIFIRCRRGVWSVQTAHRTTTRFLRRTRVVGSFVGRRWVDAVRSRVDDDDDDDVKMKMDAEWRRR